MPKAEPAEHLSINGREVRITHPDKPYFTRDARLTKLDIVRYYLSVAEGALAGIRDRPIVLKRFVQGAEGEVFYQKRAPSDKPDWMRTVTLSFPSGRTAEELVVDDAAGLAWIANLGCIELHPHPVTSSDLDHPNELRVDLDPGPGVAWDDVRTVAMEVKSFLEEMGLRGWPKTSGSRGMHVNVRIDPRWTFSRGADGPLSRCRARSSAVCRSGQFEVVEGRASRRLSRLQPEREGPHDVLGILGAAACRMHAFRHRSSGSEVPDCDPADFTVFTVPARFAAIGDPHAAMDESPGSLEKLLELADEDERAGLGDAPWPPHFRKMEGEGARVAPSRARTAGAKKRQRRRRPPERRCR